MRAASDEPKVPASTATAFVALTGNPNCGKTTLFNALTGLRAKVGNYAGVTVERKEGKMLGVGPGAPITILDLPGTYSLSPQSLDEQVSRDVLLRRLPDVPKPDLVVVVVDASNIERNLYYATQVIELGYPTILALNMVDIAAQNGLTIDAAKLASTLGVPVVPIVASIGEGVPELRSRITELTQKRAAVSPPRTFSKLPQAMASKVDQLTAQLTGAASPNRAAEAALYLADERALAPENLAGAIASARTELEQAGIDWRSAAIEARYSAVASIHQEVARENFGHTETLSDKLDRVLTHKVWGMLIFVGIMALMFQSIFTFAEYPMTWLEEGVSWVGQTLGQWIPPGDLHSLLIDGVIAGVGAVVVFLPQICLLFLFIGLLEDTGYMARAAFLMDRLMSKVGLHGKSFIPMLSSFACAIPGIMATRTIETPKDRLVTILVAPLMSCSARLPVYTLLIAACIPQTKLLGVVGARGAIMLSMYLLGIVLALVMAFIFKKTLLKGETPFLIMELPPYKRPVLKIVLRHMWDRSALFLKRAGTVILGISILLWFVATYPRNSASEQGLVAEKTKIVEGLGPGSQLSDADEERVSAIDTAIAGERLRNSFAGKLGHAIEPLIRPLGFDWKIGIGLVSSFAAREVFVSTMSTVYNVSGGGDDEEGTRTVAQTLREQTREDGSKLYTPLVGVTLMVFYVIALQCVSTVAVVRRETNSWKWPLFQLFYMGALAWIFAFVTYQGGRLLGFQ